MTNRVQHRPTIRRVAHSVAVLNAKPGRNFAAQFPHALVWKTCLREIAILESRAFASGELQPDDQLFENEGAYGFLLEVICGLHSPVLGETEVLGQFKNFAQRAQESPAWRCTAPWIQRLLADAKRVRTNHLTGLGGRSYGQLALTHLAELPRVVMLGSGHLTQEMVPWFAEHRVEVFCRRPDVAGAVLERHANACLHAMDEQLEDGVATGVIIAAPMTAAEIASWAARVGCAIETVVDLRGESPGDPLNIPASHVVHFQEIIDALETNCRFANARVERARKEIAQRATEFWDRYEVRPFGWEDLCA
jgi:glutamyl-tRNA reductase